MKMRTDPGCTARTCHLAILVMFAAAGPLSAQVKARLSSPSCSVGDQVTLVYDFSSAKSAAPDLPEIDVDGLDINLEKRRLQDWGVKHSHRLTYIVSPERPGVFRIPALELRVGDRKLRAPAVELKVVPGPGAPVPKHAPGREPPPFYPFNKPAATPPAARPTDVLGAESAPAPATKPRVPVPSRPAESRAAFARMESVSDRAYVGELVPVTLRYYLRSDLVFEGPLTQPYIAGDGFAALPLREVAPPRAPETVDGAAYNVIVFRTAVIPARAGTIKIPDAVMKGRQLVGRGWVQQPAGLPSPGGGELRDFEVAAPGRTIEAREIPQAGRPADFTGGIGDFSAASRAVEPLQVRAGEPVKLRLVIGGRGNFGALRAPVPDRTPGWRVYEPDEIFVEGAEVDGGTKTFEYRLVARQDETGTPGAGLSYFNPRTGNYESLRFEPVPVAAQGPDDGEGFLAVEQSVPPAQAPPTALLWHSTFLPALKSPWFRMLQVALFSLLVIWILLQALRKYRERRANDISARLNADLRHALDALHKAPSNPAAFYTAAARVILARLGSLQGKPAPADDAGRLLNRLVGNLARREELLAVLSRSDELKYGAGDEEKLTSVEREKVTAALENFCGMRN